LERIINKYEDASIEGEVISYGPSSLFYRYVGSEQFDDKDLMTEDKLEERMTRKTHPPPEGAALPLIARMAVGAMNGGGRGGCSIMRSTGNLRG